MYLDKPNLLPTDIIPCINYAWDRSFAQVELNKKAIADRGWGPLNYNLLCHHDLKATMTKSECEELYSMMKSNHNHPNSIYLFSQATTISDLTKSDSSTIASETTDNN